MIELFNSATIAHLLVVYLLTYFICFATSRRPLYLLPRHFTRRPLHSLPRHFLYLLPRHFTYPPLTRYFSCHLLSARYLVLQRNSIRLVNK